MINLIYHSYPKTIIYFGTNLIMNNTGTQQNRSSLHKSQTDTESHIANWKILSCTQQTNLPAILPEFVFFDKKSHDIMINFN